MMSCDRRRIARLALWAALLVFALLCVPALTRVTQQLGHGASIAQTSGFSRYSNCPPERVRLVRADLALFEIVIASEPPSAAPQVVRSDDHPAPPARAVPPAGPLRAPPAPVLL